MSAGPQYRSESRNFNPGGRYPGDQRGQNFLQRRPSNYQLGHQTYVDDDEDLDYCRPRGSTIGELEQDNFAAHRRRASFGGNLGGNNMYGSAYGMGMMGSSPREQMMRAQMMRGDLYSMDPMMGRMGLGGGYGGPGMYGGMGGYGAGPSMYGAGSAYGAVPTGACTKVQSKTLVPLALHSNIYPQDTA
ncbi:hypothetical protein PtA15_5A496 [Puccinia triticina]|uniref:Uncharacterized protein n=1 Tax=Puccinia triticina TaxID=208348 RepID=A0ABY7CI84_9BASI|nr:uncharacterized protein PtA15_5A496 [Puccinia triticina]WAQ84923.1 hypothetical protein PtA15_5A496 [Puccinia triticina]WAR58258.1 hypothetical protein PtB15_5B491 [Puccinia triticina]